MDIRAIGRRRGDLTRGRRSALAAMATLGMNRGTSRQGADHKASPGVHRETRPHRSVGLIEVRRRERPGSGAAVRSSGRSETDEARPRPGAAGVAKSPREHGRPSSIPNARRGQGESRSASSPGELVVPSTKGHRRAWAARRELNRSPGRALSTRPEGPRPKTGTSSARRSASNSPTIERAHRERPPRACRAHPQRTEPTATHLCDAPLRSLDRTTFFGIETDRHGTRRRAYRIMDSTPAPENPQAARAGRYKLVPTLCVGMPMSTLCVVFRNRATINGTQR
jgi:hypothetical protein